MINRFLMRRISCRSNRDALGKDSKIIIPLRVTAATRFPAIVTPADLVIGWSLVIKEKAVPPNFNNDTLKIFPRPVKKCFLTCQQHGKHMIFSITMKPEASDKEFQGQHIGF